MSKLTLITSAWAIAVCSLTQAAVKLPALFSDNMVLQNSNAAPLWGQADPGEQVSVRFAGQSTTDIADAKGHWRLALDLSHAPPAPGEMIVSGNKTTAPISIRNVVVGEVWLAAGQSNMEKPLGPHPGQHPVDRYEQEVAESGNAGIRVFTVTPKASDKPLEDCQGKWEIASPQTTAHFTATGYFFAREINRELRTPVGIIHSSWGGTRVEAWTSLEGAGADPELAALAKEEVEAFENYPRRLKEYHAALADWAKAHGREDPGNKGEKEGSADPAAPVIDWQSINMGSGKKGSVPPGIRWYRKTVTIPPEWNGRAAYLSLGTINGLDTAYFNNTRVGGIDIASAERAGGPRMYLVPGRLMRPGAATIAVRVVSFLPTDAPVTQAYRMALTCASNQGLGGPWLYKNETTFAALGAEAIAKYPLPPPGLPYFDTASFLFNGMIHPLIPYGIAGAIWYQGESNADFSPWVYTMHPDSPWYRGEHADPSALYLRAFPAMIRDWRAQWGRSAGRNDFPFYYCQIANYGKKNEQPTESRWAQVREAQRRTLALVPNVGMAVLIDIGQAKDIHPTNKQEVGRRLALQALAQTYGRKIEYSGPLYQSMAIEQDRIRLKFTHAEGLSAKPLPDTYQPQSYNPATAPLIKPRPQSALQGFEICGADGKWFWADATIEGETVLVSSASVKAPTAVRYAWSDNPTCNLYNAANLPASPFSTADWPR